MYQTKKFRNKKNIIGIYLVLLISFFCVKSKAQPICPVPCLTNVIQLGTGWNHENDSVCAYQTSDPFWRITKAPNVYSVPMCAYSRIDIWNNWPFPITGTIKNTSIGADPMPFKSAGNKTNNANTCTIYQGDNPYWFDRQFFVCTGDSATVSMGMLLQYEGDLVIPRVELFGPSGYYNLLEGTCLFNGNTGTINNFNLHLATGIYTLRFHVLNDYLDYPFLGSPNGNTPMMLQVGGSVFSTLGNNVLVDNKHFGKSVGICAPPYEPSPEFGLNARHCLKDSSDTVQVHITQFYDSIGQNSYVVTGPIANVNVPIDTNGMFIATVGSYTITSVDKWGCVFDSILNLYLNPNFSATPPYQCVPVGSSGNIALHVDSSILDYGFQTNGGGIWGTNDTNVIFAVGYYIITCVDQNAGNCTTNDTVVVGNIPTLVASATPPCIDTNMSAIIWTMATPALNSYHYEIYDPSNTLLDSMTTAWIQTNTQPGVTGIYTVYVSDTLSGCMDTTTVAVYAVPIPDLVLTSSKGCIGNGGNAIITATPNNPGNYTYQLNGGAPQVGNQFIVNAPGNYSVTVLSPDGCSSVPKMIHIGDCSKCQNDSIYESATWYSNPTSSIDFGAATPLTPIVIDGTLTMNANLNIWNNPNVFFTPWSKIEMVSSGPAQILSIKNSTLKPCNISWTGILANNVDENVNIDSSILTGMQVAQGGNWVSGGVNMTNGALINATNSNFINNWVGIVIMDVSFNYTGVIKNNIFDKLYTWPAANQGIVIWDVKDMEVGGLVNVNEGNTFRNLEYTGIDVRHSKNITYNSHVKLYNNKFDNIKYAYGGNPQLNDAAILYSAGNYCWGSAISAIGWYNDHLTVDVDNTPGDPTIKIINCDIGISSDNANMNIAHSDIDNTLLGILSKSLGNVKYNVHDNIVNNAHIGIAQYGNIVSTQINNNIINTRNAQILTSGGSYVSTIGIDINHSLFEYNPTGGQYNHIANNMIMVQAKAGVGIFNQNSDSHEIMIENNIYFSNISNDPISNSDLYACFGIINMNAKKTNLTGNYIYGHPSLQGFNDRNRIGVLMSFSPNNVLECNKVRHSRYGFYAWGDNTTAKTNIKYNKFNANAYPWYFLDFGSASPATYGNVGSGTTDNGNEMISVSNPVNWLNAGGLNPGLFKVFRNSASQPGFSIFSDPSVLDFPESGSSIPLNQYFVQPPANGYTDPCADSLFIMGTNDTTKNDIDSSELEQGLAVALDSVTYINYQEVGAWFGKYRLFANLDTDSLLLNSTPEMLYFFSEQQANTIGAINEADKKIALLSDSTIHDSNFVVRFNNAVNANNSITSENEWEMNERFVNALKLKIISGIVDTIGYDTLFIDSLGYLTIPITSSISIEEKDFLRELAHTCPFVGGNAVYKARPLWALFSPGAIYDDRLLCIMGQNKNADYSNLNIDSLYESQIVANFKTQNMVANPPINTKHKMLEDGEVLIYPNPASTQITVEFKCKSDGEFILYNGVGQQVLKTDLQNDKTQVSLLTNDLPKGVYTFKCIFAGCESKMGKLTIIK